MSKFKYRLLWTLNAFGPSVVVLVDRIVHLFGGCLGH